jgi:pyruvate/2-oxoglutarate dehydrogenase complex dihydrolipoamide acyltransferase (E2) component
MVGKVLSLAKPRLAPTMSPPMSPLPPKKEVALALLERSSVHVYLDPRSKEVIVPPWLAKQPRLVLQIGLNMPVPIPDLRLDDDAMTCTLSFNHSPFLCVVPWKCVFAMVGDDSRGMVWPDDVPPELSIEGAARPLEAAPAPAVRSVPKKERRPALAEAPKPAASASAAPATKAKRTRKKAVAKDGAITATEEAKIEAPGRPIAVPARAPAPRAAPQPAAAVTPAASPPAASPPAIRRPGSGKPKRELPPYLRVVK